MNILHTVLEVAPAALLALLAFRVGDLRQKFDDQTINTNNVLQEHRAQIAVLQNQITKATTDAFNAKQKTRRICTAGQKGDGQ